MTWHWLDTLARFLLLVPVLACLLVLVQVIRESLELRREGLAREELERAESLIDQPFILQTDRGIGHPVNGLRHGLEVMGVIAQIDALPEVPADHPKVAA